MTRKSKHYQVVQPAPDLDNEYVSLPWWLFLLFLMVAVALVIYFYGIWKHQKELTKLCVSVVSKI
jgi:hypothetical protein